MAYLPIMQREGAIAAISGTDWNIFRGEIVYAWFRDGVCLYVGHTICGFSRILNHNVINVVDKVLPTDEIRIRFVQPNEDGLLLEAKSIENYGPKYNKAHSDIRVKSNRTCSIVNCERCKKPFEQKRWWQRLCHPKCKPKHETETSSLS